MKNVSFKMLIVLCAMMLPLWTSTMARAAGEMVYHVDCGDDSPSVLEADEAFGARQSIEEQPYGLDTVTGYVWGYETYGGTWSQDNGDTQWDSIRTDEGDTAGEGIIYRFEVDSGAYDVTFGVEDPWNNGSRVVDVFIENVLVEAKLVLGAEDKLTRTYTGRSVSDGELTFELRRTEDNSDSNGDPIISWIEVFGPTGPVDPNPTPTPTPVEKINIDPAAQYQEFEGWGTSLAWFGNVIGGWSEPVKNAIADMLFDQEQGLGLNVVRYNIGGGENPDHDHLRIGGDVPGYKPAEDGGYDWTADANQRWFLQAAIERGANIKEAFSNSPPYWMTNSGCVSGSADGVSNNLKDDYYDDFADYLTEVVRHFHEEWGITFDTLEPVNEPMATWWKAYGWQEGAHFDIDKQALIINEVHQKLADKGLSDFIKISAMDASNMDNSITAFNAYGADTKSMISQYNTHAYSGSKRADVRYTAAKYGKKLWMSEVDAGGGMGFDPEHILPGLELARMITRDLREMQPRAWVFWQAVENWPNMMPQAENLNWGLILANFEGEGAGGLAAEAYRTTKKYYTMAQFTKFIRPGFRMIGIDQDDSVALIDWEAGRLVIVSTNRSISDNEMTYDLSGFDTTGVTAAMYRTSSEEQMTRLGDLPIANGAMNVTLPGRSITTWVIDGVSYAGKVKLNDTMVGSGLNQFSFQGDWKYSGTQSGAYTDDNQWSGAAGDYYQVRFNGTRVQIYGALDPCHGIAAVSLDRGPETDVDFYAAGRQDQALVYTSPELPGGEHVLTVRVTGRRNSSASGVTIPVDRVDVFGR
jgi:O-glycosyl hydrolase